MKRTIVKDIRDAKNDFFAMKTRADVAKVLEVPQSVLIYILYRTPQSEKYKNFDIPKKSGGVRTITSPNKSLKILQRKLLSILEEIYVPTEFTNGFVKGRGLISAAQPHTRKRSVLNVDIEAFFPTIHIGRIIGLFQSKPFLFSKEVAVTLAQIACYEGVLPQGSPCSPILSNMICRGLDKDLTALSRRHNIFYSRYADDITLSSTRTTFPQEIVTSKDGAIVISRAFESCIQDHGFKLNIKKTRLQLNDSRQEVVGLTVNKKVNIGKKYIRQVRVLLNLLRKHGDDVATRIYISWHERKVYSDHANLKLSNVVLGKISFIRSVRGSRDPVYRKLYNQYGSIMIPGFIKMPVTSIDEILGSIWTVSTMSGDFCGTAFALKDVGIVTCQHVVKKQSILKIMHFSTKKEYIAEIIGGDEVYDIAILRINEEHGNYLKAGSTELLKVSTQVFIAGFPNYRKHDEPQYYETKISSFQVEQYDRRDPITRYVVQQSIYSGMSGSPVLNSQNEVVGIAVLGAKNAAEKNEVWGYKFTPINYLQYI